MVDQNKTHTNYSCLLGTIYNMNIKIRTKDTSFEITLPWSNPSLEMVMTVLKESFRELKEYEISKTGGNSK